MVTFIRRTVTLLFVTTLLGSVWAAPVFPVKYGANNRYLVDQNDAPFPIMGRTAWFVTALPVADSHDFIDDTAARGYSAIEFHVVNHDPRGSNPPFDGSGNLPFLYRLDGTAWDDGSLSYGNINNEAPDFTTPNEAYWSQVDGFLSYCESKGILVFLFPAYVGYAGGEQGWMQEMVANGATKMQSYGAWIATRYKDRKNLVWMMGGDLGAFTTAQNNVESALWTGLKSVPGEQSVLFSAEWDSETIATDQATFGASMTLNGVYSWSGDVNDAGRRAYAHNPVEPAFLLEEPYDEEGPDGNGYNPNGTQPVRRFQWWGWLSTIGGYISGNGYVIWFLAPDWRDHLDTQGSRDMMRLNAFMGSIAWYNLVPTGLNGMRTLITAGGSSESSSDYVAAAATADGTLLVAYVPPAHSGSITVAMGAMSGPARARWFDPTSGAYNAIGTGLTNAGSRAFTTPGNNSVGAKDWVLVLDYTNGISLAAPTISGIPDQSTTVNTATAAIPFTIGDADTPVGNLTLSAGSSNPTLVPTNNIVFGDSGANRTVTVTPAASQTGSATITVGVSDGQITTSTNFVVTVSSLFMGTKSFTNSTAITIPDSGKASPYPSTINVTGVNGTISTVTVMLANFSHTWKSDVDILLVSPGGQQVKLMSDAGSAYTASGSVTITLSDAAAASLPASTALSSGTYKPTDYTDSSPGGDNFPAPAPAAPYATNLSAFNGQSPNGTWSLYVFDDGPGDLGSIAGGWGVTLTTVSAGGSLPPAISDIPDQSTTVNTPTAAIPFTINDADTPVGNLTVSAGSSNPALVPTNNIVFGGSGTNRTVTVTPTGNQTGTATITVSVSDGTNSASDSFGLTVNAVNTPPTITGIADQTINEDTSTAALGFTVGDAETAPGNLTLNKGSSNPILVPTNSIVFGGSGANRTVTVTPAANQNGAATITVTVSDGQYAATTNFAVMVSAVNDAPTITGIADQTINVNTSTGPLSFTIGDAETTPGSLTLSGTSSNPTLLPTSNIVFGGSGASRTVAVSPAANQTGSATITVGVSDGQITTSTNFVVTVSSSSAGTKSFTNSTAITIPDSGKAAPYPSTINVTGMDGTISNVTVMLASFSHTWKSDVDILLVSPGGQQVKLMSDAGSAYTASGSVTITLSDAAAASLPASTALSSGTYKPTDYTDSSPGGDNFPAPAPAAPYATNLSAFNGQSPNGTWSLYVFDDGPGDLGSIANGWSVTISTATASFLAGPPGFVSVGNPPKITSLTFDQGDIALTLSGEVGLSYALEASSDLVNWTQVTVQDNTTGSLLFRDRPTTNAIRFYRAVAVPK